MRAAFHGLFLLLLVAIAGEAVAGEQDDRDTFLRARERYAEALETTESESRLERFRQSERLFASLAKDGGIESAGLYVAWGNAALQAHRAGPAVLAYRRALVLDPGDRQARENLDHVRDLLPAWVPRPGDDAVTGTFLFWRHALSRSGRATLAALLFLAGCLLLAVWVRWGKPWARNLALLPLLLWLALVLLPVVDPEGAAASDAVILADEAVVRAADSAGAPTRFAEPLPGGTEVEVVEVRDAWLRIRLADGRDGWVSRGRVAWVDPRRP